MQLPACLSRIAIVVLAMVRSSRSLVFACLAGCVVLPCAFAADPAGDHSNATPKTVASGLYMTGYSATCGTNYSTVTVTVDELDNDSFTRTTGTLKIEYWAAIDPPPRATGFTGYR